MKDLFLALFLLVILANGAWCVISPEAVVRFRTSMGWSTSYLSGGFAYATPQRTRVTGSLLIAVVLFAATVRVFGR